MESRTLSSQAFASNMAGMSSKASQVDEQLALVRILEHIYDDYSFDQHQQELSQRLLAESIPETLEAESAVSVRSKTVAVRSVDDAAHAVLISGVSPIAWEERVCKVFEQNPFGLDNSTVITTAQQVKDSMRQLAVNTVCEECRRVVGGNESVEADILAKKKENEAYNRRLFYGELAIVAFFLITNLPGLGKGLFVMSLIELIAKMVACIWVCSFAFDHLCRNTGDNAKMLEGAQNASDAAKRTLQALGPYERALTTEEIKRMGEQSRMVRQEAQKWVADNAGELGALSQFARQRYQAAARAIGLMPNAIPNALELSVIIADGYALDIHEALNFLATERWRKTQTSIGMAQLEETRAMRVQTGEYLQAMMGELHGINGRLDTANAWLGEMSGQLDGIARTTERIATSNDRIASSAERAANSAERAAHHAEGTERAASDLRTWYAEDHPDYDGNYVNMRSAS